MPCPRKTKGNPKSKAKGNPKHKKHTPIVSKAQRGVMGAALAKKKGKKIKLRGPAKKVAKSMTKTKLRAHLKESKGKKLPGHYGAKSHTVKGLEVLLIDSEKNTIFIKGAVPGARNGIVFVTKQS